MSEADEIARFDTLGPSLPFATRVRVLLDRDFPTGPWPAEPTGNIVEHPLSADGDTWRPIMTTSGLRRFYWVAFDEPQLDGDGDGPYFEAEVLDVHLVRLDIN